MTLKIHLMGYKLFFHPPAGGGGGGRIIKMHNIYPCLWSNEGSHPLVGVQVVHPVDMPFCFAMVSQGVQPAL